MKLSTAKIGRAGELLVQYRLLLLGIDSAPMTTDAGIDLVAYAPGNQHAWTIQVKTNLRPKPSGGKGRAALDWWVPEDSPAELHALVDLSEQRIWLWKAEELAEAAHQRSRGRLHFYMHTDPATKPTKARPVHVFEFGKYLLENRAPSIFGASK